MRPKQGIWDFNKGLLFHEASSWETISQETRTSYGRSTNSSGGLHPHKPRPKTRSEENTKHYSIEQDSTENNAYERPKDNFTSKTSIDYNVGSAWEHNYFAHRKPLTTSSDNYQKTTEEKPSRFHEGPGRRSNPIKEKESHGNAKGTQRSFEPEEGVAYADTKASTGEVLTYGVRSVWRGFDISELGDIWNDRYAFVIDSGVSDLTKDINLDSSLSKSWIAGESPFSDGMGHGTHVAGTIGALANGKGIVGVAPGAQIVSLKVFDYRGRGATEATIAEAITYAATTIINKDIDKSKAVINLSLSGYRSSFLDSLIKDFADSGIRFSVAAGNSGWDADYYSPASAGDHENVYTVSAVDNQYQMPEWSNWDDKFGGDDIDLSAPGVNVYSLGSNGNLKPLSGTSMAAPHVAGLLLTGGASKGQLTTPSSTGYADPFAVANLEQLESLVLSGKPLENTQEVETPPTASRIETSAWVEIQENQITQSDLLIGSITESKDNSALDLWTEESKEQAQLGPSEDADGILLHTRDTEIIIEPTLAYSEFLRAGQSAIPSDMNALAGLIPAENLLFENSLVNIPRPTQAWPA